MKVRIILLGLLACLALEVSSQPTQQEHEWEWYLDEVVSETFVQRNDFEYYYQPSAADMEQQRSKGEVTYFLNSPGGLNSQKTRDLIDRLMASYDDIKAMSDWHVTSGSYWKEFRHERNKFRFSVKRKALDDGTYYVSVTETADFYKSLGKKGKASAQKEPKEKSPADKPAKRNSRKRQQVSTEEASTDLTQTLTGDDEEETVEPKTDALTAQQRRRAARLREQEEKREKQATLKREKEEKRLEEKKLKEAEKQRRADEKKKRQEEERLKKEEKRQLREQERRAKLAERQRAATPPAPAPVESKYHATDIALWLSEKYDFTQTAGGNNSITMFSTAVKDLEMAKLAIKNALKGSNARMAVPWRLNSETGMTETGYTVDDHVLVFAIGKNEDDNATITITEVSNEQFELFKQSFNE